MRTDTGPPRCAVIAAGGWSRFIAGVLRHRALLETPPREPLPRDPARTRRAAHPGSRGATPVQTLGSTLETAQHGALSFPCRISTHADPFPPPSLRAPPRRIL